MYSFVYNHCNNKLPKAISNVVTHSNASDYSVTTRYRNLFNVTHHNSHHGKLLLNNYCYNLWQSLPQNIKSATSLRTFQSNLKDKLIKNYM